MIGKRHCASRPLVNRTREICSLPQNYSTVEVQNGSYAGRTKGCLNVAIGSAQGYTYVYRHDSFSQCGLMWRDMAGMGVKITRRGVAKIRLRQELLGFRIAK
jgi:hypothetical protein